MGVRGQAYRPRAEALLGGVTRGNRSEEKGGRWVRAREQTLSWPSFTTKQQGAWWGDIFQRALGDCGARAGTYLPALTGQTSCALPVCPLPHSRQLDAGEPRCQASSGSGRKSHSIPKSYWEGPDSLTPTAASTCGNNCALGQPSPGGAEEISWGPDLSTGQEAMPKGREAEPFWRSTLTGQVWRLQSKMQSLHVLGGRKHEQAWTIFEKKISPTLSSHSREHRTFVRYKITVKGRLAELGTRDTQIGSKMACHREICVGAFNISGTMAGHQSKLFFFK